MHDFDKELDARNLHCPVPVMKTKQAINKMDAGEVIHVMATDPAAPHDIDLLLSIMDHELLEKEQIDGTYHFYIKKIAK